MDDIFVFAPTTDELCSQEDIDNFLSEKDYYYHGEGVHWTNLSVMDNIEALAAESLRIAPDCHVVFLPNLSKRRFGGVYGVCFGWLLLSCYSAPHMLSTVYHEAFHAIQHRLTDEELAAIVSWSDVARDEYRRLVDFQLDRDEMWADHVEYLKRNYERGARAFERWAWSRAESYPLERPPIWRYRKWRIFANAVEIFRQIDAGQVAARDEN